MINFLARAIAVIVSMSSSCSYASDCIPIDAIKLVGIGDLEHREIRQIRDQYVGKCLSIEQIRAVVREMTNYYVESGYITTRVYLPEQDLSEGILQINIQEGIIEDIEVVGSKRSSNIDFFPANLPLRRRNTLNLRDIEQSTDNYNKLKSNNTNIALKPGNKPGGTILVIDNKASKKWRVVSGVDNAGSKQKGELQSYNNFTLENITGGNELYNFGYRTSLDDPSIRHTAAYTAMFLMPFGYNDLGLSYNQGKYKNFIHGINNSYSNRGSSKVYKVDLSRSIHRNGSGKTSLLFGAAWEEYSNYIANYKLDISTYKVRKFDLGLSHQRKFASGVLGTGISFTYGVNKGFVSSYSNLRVPEKHFSKVNANAFWLVPLPIIVADRKLQYQLQLEGQYSTNLLVGSEKSTLGGLSSIRGFKDYSENADNMVLARNELALPLPIGNNPKIKSLFGEVSIFAAFDIGGFRNHEEIGSRSGVMSGIATGIKNKDGHINFSLTYARPMQAPVLFKHANILYFSLALDV